MQPLYQIQPSSDVDDVALTVSSLPVSSQLRQNIIIFTSSLQSLDKYSEKLNLIFSDETFHSSVSSQRAAPSGAQLHSLSLPYLMFLFLVALSKQILRLRTKTALVAGSSFHAPESKQGCSRSVRAV